MARMMFCDFLVTKRMKMANRGPNTNNRHPKNIASDMVGRSIERCSAAADGGESTGFPTSKRPI
jgi:hypothetical protein